MTVDLSALTLDDALRDRITIAAVCPGGHDFVFDLGSVSTFVPGKRRLDVVVSTFAYCPTCGKNSISAVATAGVERL